jgi:hypothetical protein
MKGLKGLRVCQTAYLAHFRPVGFRCGAVPNGPRENGARKGEAPVRYGRGSGWRAEPLVA